VAIAPSGKFLYGIGMASGSVYQIGVNASTGELTLLASATESADFREVVVDPSGKFIFANDLTGGRIFAYLAGGSSLSPGPGSPFVVPANGQPIQLAIDNTGDFLYGPLISGGIAGFAVSSTGALSDIAGSPFAASGQPFILAADLSGKFLYAIDANLINGIAGFNIDASTGALILLLRRRPSTALPWMVRGSSSTPALILTRWRVA
jgi:6-phosphogluconolactonase